MTFASLHAGSRYEEYTANYSCSIQCILHWSRGMGNHRLSSKLINLNLTFKILPLTFASLHSAGSRYEDYTANSICSVYYTGRVVWQSPAIIKTHCTMDVTKFPFDFQTCTVTFGPWQHNQAEILLNGTGKVYVMKFQFDFQIMI